MNNAIKVKVIPNAKKNLVKEENQGLKIYLVSPPVKGKANRLLIKILAKHLNCKERQLRILRGLKSRNKLIEKIN